MPSATRNSGDEHIDQAHALYSSKVDKAILVINGGAYSLLQYVTTQSWAPTNAVADGPKTTLAFLVLILIYAILGVCEVKLQNRYRIRNFIGHTSHLSGALAAIVLISLISPIFTIIAGALWFVWVFAVMYLTFAERKSSEENESEARPQLPV
ncbi:hypothetical protein V5N11_034466 [Cardamine amara subsp. amara]|uniref:Uncharacterized protein n=1 Tax=Cardamine amara subsp. amara TaxID=228776 RepID=A0ABD1B4C9_CARAN